VADKINIDDEDILQNKLEIKLKREESRRSMVLEPPVGNEKPMIKSHRLNNNSFKSKDGTGKNHQPAGSTTIKLAGN